MIKTQLNKIIGEKKAEVLKYDANNPLRYNKLIPKIVQNEIVEICFLVNLIIIYQSQKFT